MRENLKLVPVAKPREITVEADVTLGTLAIKVVPSFLYSLSKWLTALGDAMKVGLKVDEVIVVPRILVGVARVLPAKVVTEIFVLAAEELKKTPLPIASNSIL